MKPKKPTELSQKQLDRMKLLSADLPGLMEYAHSVGGFSVVPTSEGAIKGKALDAMHQQTQTQMNQIKEQMLLLARQANEIKKRVEVSHEIYQAKISFKPVIGHLYFLYDKPNGQKMLSLISPEEWGADSKLTLVARVKLLADHTWDAIVSNESEEANDGQTVDV
ncbi:DUF2452 domain-containing protein [Oligoflexaceae bacterium]|nr:DUF2452 domain-containing protein [Oligoflexaceae bacterium]